MLNRSPLSNLIECWRVCRFDTPPFILPDDESEIPDNMRSLYQSFDEFIVGDKFGQIEDKSLHVGLLPIPYIGNLSGASVFILMLNPGLSPGDYFAEQGNSEFKEAHLRNLRQENGGDEFPFFFLDPLFSWHPGFEYWQGKVYDIALAFMRKEQVTYQDALKRIARNIACLELMPYHSKAFGAGSLLKRLTSTKLMLEYAQDIVIPKARSGDATVIVTRGARHWDLDSHRNVVVYESSAVRSAHLTLKSPGGKAIAKQLGL